VLKANSGRSFILTLGAAVTAAQGSAKPTAGFAFNQVDSFVSSTSRALQRLSRS